MSLLAQIKIDDAAVDQRGSARRTVTLDVQAILGADGYRARVHNLSHTGLLIETDAPLKRGDPIEVFLPEVGLITGVAVRAHGAMFGCRFVRPVSRAAISAALLRSRIEPSSRPETLAPEPAFSEWREYAPVLPPVSDAAALTGMLLLLPMVGLFLFSLLAMAAS